MQWGWEALTQAPQGQLGKSQGLGACWTRSLGACDWGRLGAGQELPALQGQQGFPLSPCMLSVQSVPAHSRQVMSVGRQEPLGQVLFLLATLV